VNHRAGVLIVGVLGASISGACVTSDRGASHDSSADAVASLRRQVERLEVRLAYLEPPTGPEAEALAAETVRVLEEEYANVENHLTAGKTSPHDAQAAKIPLLEARIRLARARDPWSTASLAAVERHYDELVVLARTVLDSRRQMVESGNITQLEFHQALLELSRFELARLRLQRLRRDLEANPSDFRAPTPAATSR